MVVKTVKSRKHHKTIKVDELGIFTCPKLKQRPQMTAAMCLRRQERRHRGCVTCRIPQKIERKKES